jgi:membrane protease YdiL (CAAX protease family)
MIDHTASRIDAPQVPVTRITRRASHVALPPNEPRRRSSWVSRHDLPLFVVLTFVLSWLFWPFVLVNPGSSPLVPFGPLPVTLLSTMVIVGLFEEVGWRGFALPRLRRTYGALSSALVIGAVWAAWHLPELVSEPAGQLPALPFLLVVLSQSVILAWLYHSTRGSLPIVIIFHAAFNTYGRYVLPAFAGEHFLAMSWSVAIVHLATAAVVTWRGIGDHPAAVHDSSPRPTEA